MHDDLRLMLDANPELRLELAKAVANGLDSMAAPAPMRGSEWADKYFYLSAESSYVQGGWKTWPFQRAILDCMCNDEIESVTMRKPARVGYSKMFLAAIGYYAEHKKRNQVVYQPTDGDASGWVKSELDPMLRDVRAMRRVFPEVLRRSKDNTLEQKSFLGSMLHIRGGKAAKNYRRITVDVVYLDEVDGFDTDIEKEGSPVKLSAKRLEGALFPKHIKGSTPKLKGSSLIDAEHDAAELQLRFHVPCPHCEHEHPLEWGGDKVPHGFKWSKDDPEQVVHVCPRCGVGYTQNEYLGVWHRGRWIAANGVWIDDSCNLFRDRAGQVVDPPRTVAFSLWTAYSPQATWRSIVAEFIEAVKALRRGDHGPMQTWVNTTKGESFEISGAQNDAGELKKRAKQETYRLRLVPRAGLALCCGVDVQDNRFIATVWAFGRDDESWLVDYRTIWADPARWSSWLELDAYLATRFPHEGGQTCAIDATAIDTGGHFTHQVYKYVMLRETRRVHAVKGHSVDGKPIVAGAPSRVDVNVDGQIVKDGVKLWMVGTDTAKDLLFNRLRNAMPGPGYMHFSAELPDSFFDELVSEKRVEVKTASGRVFRWVKLTSSTPNHVRDTAVYAIFCAYRMKLHQYTDAEWRRIEQALCPPTADLFTDRIEPVPLPPPPEPGAAPDTAAAPPAPAPVLAAVDTATLWAAGRQQRRRVLSRGIE